MPFIRNIPIIDGAEAPELEMVGQAKLFPLAPNAVVILGLALITIACPGRLRLTSVPPPLAEMLRDVRHSAVWEQQRFE